MVALYNTSCGNVKKKVKVSDFFFYKAKGVGMKVMMKMIKAMRPRVFLLASKGVSGSIGLG